MHNSPDDRDVTVQHRILSESSGGTGSRLVMSVVLILFALFFIGAALFKRGAALQLEELASLLIFLAIGVGILVFTLRKRRKQPNYGPTMVELFESPVVPGGRLVGRAVTGLSPQALPREGFVVRLSYMESRGDDETRSTSKLWSDQQRVSAMPSEEHESSVVIPIALDLPRDLPPRWNERRDRTYWKLSFNADLPEGSFSDAVTVPVETQNDPPTDADSPTDTEPTTGADAELYRQMKAYELPPPDRPLSPGIELSEMASTFELRLTPRYYRWEALFSTGVALAFGGATALLIYAGGCAWLLAPIFGFIALGIGKSAFESWFRVASITVDGGEVILQNGIPQRQKVKHLPIREIENIEVAPAVRETKYYKIPSGGTYQFVFHLTDERDVRLGAVLSDKEEAIRLSERVTTAARIPSAGTSSG